MTSRRAEGKGEDIEEPLDPSDQQAQESLFASIHNLKLEPSVCPSDALFARCFREFKKGGVSVFPLNK
eukprot:1855893-Amphidinium_carterae.1